MISAFRRFRFVTREVTDDTTGKLMVAIVAAVVLPAVFLGISTWDERIQLIKAAEGEAATMAGIAGEHALKVFESQELLIRDLDRRVAGMTWDEIRAAAPALSAEMRSMHAALPQVSAIGITDPEGRIRAGTLPLDPAAPMAIANRELWQAQRDADQGTFVSRPYTGTLVERLNFGVSRRRTTGDGSFDGTIHVAVAVSYFLDFWKEAVSRRQDATVTLLRADGEVLARFPGAGEPLLRAPPRAKAFTDHVGTGADSGFYTRTSSIDGIERIYAYKKVGNYPLYIRYGLSVQAVLATWRQHLLAAGAACAAAVAALVVALLSSMRNMHRLLAARSARAAEAEAAQEGQRLELLGQLAAGVAHDFGNIMHAVGGGAYLIEKSAHDPDDVRSHARMLAEAAKRGGSLVQQMLDLARRDSAGDGGAPESTNPVEAILCAQELLSRVLGGRHQVRCEIERNGLPGSVRGSRTALEAALINLAVNARDAMPDGGRIVIRAAPERIVPGTDTGTANGLRNALVPGSYARISVADSGAGMPPEVMARAGETFFTTKPRGRGTGLGLSGARGFAERSGGAISIESEVGQGTTVTLWLPAVSRQEEPNPAMAR